jgi:hypothetical protein
MPTIKKKKKSLPVKAVEEHFILRNWEDSAKFDLFTYQAM